jgi:uncharacterized protein YdeI (YjbR/CyaY-like superfamily)
MNPKVEFFFSKAEKWRDEFKKLRKIVLEFQLTEELKWGKPCYKGALLKDPRRILIQQTENVQAARQIRFTNVREIVELEPILKAYIAQAIEVEKAGLKVDFKKTSEFSIPAELQKKLDEVPALRTAFNSLTPGRQRGYILYFSAPKQSQTRESRIEKCMPQILKGRGLNDE